MSISGDKSRLIINVAKEDSQALVWRARPPLAPPPPPPRIKNHQMEGARFMWKPARPRFPSPPRLRLLAHTMGLGKTMQVITLLVAHRRSLRFQRSLRLLAGTRRTPAIQDIDPVSPWADRQLARRIASVGTSRLAGPALRDNQPDRAVGTRPLGSGLGFQGGVLIVGYSMFRKLVKDEELATVLWEKPNIVVGDEAHKMKNPNSQISKVTQDFRTMSRIAMTGSP